jgi:hypothetical protein
MQTVGEAPGAIEGEKQADRHPQGGWEPSGNVTVCKQVVKYPDYDIVGRWHGVSTFREHPANRSPPGQPGDEDGEELVKPKKMVRRHIYARGEVKGGE